MTTLSINGAWQAMAYKVRSYNSLYADKLDIAMEIVATMRGTVLDREMELIVERTRTAAVNEIHELILTDEPGQELGSTVNRVAYIGFAMLENGGVLAVGDTLYAGDRALGILIGFDYNHMPNHMNILFHADPMKTGEELGLTPGEQLLLSRR